MARKIPKGQTKVGDWEGQPPRSETELSFLEVKNRIKSLEEQFDEFDEWLDDAAYEASRRVLSASLEKMRKLYGEMEEVMENAAIDYDKFSDINASLIPQMKQNWEDVLRGAGPVTTTATHTDKLYNISYSGRRDKEEDEDDKQ
jgi:hypothetical protein